MKIEKGTDLNTRRPSLPRAASFVALVAALAFSAPALFAAARADDAKDWHQRAQRRLEWSMQVRIASS